ncbi:unnamed protein product [Parajaminaea phylloscopi]
MQEAKELVALPPLCCWTLILSSVVLIPFPLVRLHCRLHNLIRLFSPMTRSDALSHDPSLTRQSRPRQSFEHS